MVYGVLFSCFFQCLGISMEGDSSSLGSSLLASPSASALGDVARAIRAPVFSLVPHSGYNFHSIIWAEEENPSSWLHFPRCDREQQGAETEWEMLTFLEDSSLTRSWGRKSPVFWATTVGVEFLSLQVGRVRRREQVLVQIPQISLILPNCSRFS